MLTPTSTSSYSDIAFVTTDLVTSILPYLYVIIGIVLAFYIIDTLISITHPTKKDTGYGGLTKYDEQGNVKFIEFD